MVCLTPDIQACAGWLLVFSKVMLIASWVADGDANAIIGKSMIVHAEVIALIHIPFLRDHETRMDTFTQLNHPWCRM